MELDEQSVLAGVERGLDVVHIDLDQGLAAFPDGQFDVVVLSQTLQTVIDVPRVIQEMLRVGRRGIVNFPNLGYYKSCGGSCWNTAARRWSRWAAEPAGTIPITSAF